MKMLMLGLVGLCVCSVTFAQKNSKVVCKSSSTLLNVRKEMNESIKSDEKRLKDGQTLNVSAPAIFDTKTGLYPVKMCVTVTVEQIEKVEKVSAPKDFDTRDSDLKDKEE